MTLGLPVVVMGGIAVVGACTPDKLQIPQDDGGTSAEACGTPSPGTFPKGDCATDQDNGPPTCHSSSACMINEAVCGSKATCLPMSTNKGKEVLDFRIRRLSVLAPKALASGTIQTAVIDHGITLGAKQCGENGDGSFTWLFRVDKSANTVKTGGSPPTTDPFGIGYCFADTVVGGNRISPVTGKISFTGNTFGSDTIPKLTVPIFVANDPNQLILLPLSGVAVKDVTISNDGDCIGSFNPSALDDLCFDSRSDCSRWHTAGALAGYITLEEADTVPIPQLGNKSLCVMLTGGSAGPDNKCIRVNGKIKDPGDYCSTSGKAGDCQDSYWLAATFAAAAVKIKDASTDPLCMGGTAGDGGMGDGGGDAGNDASDAAHD